MTANAPPVDGINPSVTHFAAIGYSRFDQIAVIVRNGRHQANLVADGTGSAIKSAYFVAYCCDENGRDVEQARSPLFTSAPWSYVFDTSQWPDGHYVISVDEQPDLPTLHEYIIVANHGPVPGPQWVPVGAENGKHAFSETGEQGWEWVHYVPGNGPDATVPRGATLKPRAFTPIVEADFAHDKTGARAWQQPQHENLWQEPVTACGSIPPHEFVYISDNGRDSFVTISAIQPYTQNDDFRLLLGQNRDGVYGIGRVGCGICDYVEMGGESALSLAPNGRLSRVYINGPRKGEVRTLLGPRLKDSNAPAPHLPMGNVSAALAAWHASFYETVGTIDGKPANLNNPWQVWPDDRYPGKAFIAEADANRLVYVNLETGIGETWAGATDGGDGYLDGQGTAARFRKVRGVCVKLGATEADDVIYIADDHNSALRASDRSRNITTVVQSQRALGEAADLGRGVNYALVALPQTGGYVKYIPLIRSHLKDGPFESAVWMHPNQLGLTSNGDVVTACHHPHNIVRFKLAERAIVTVANMNPLMQAGKLEESWISLSVDRFGVMGQVDNIVVGYFLDCPALVYTIDGKPLGRYYGNNTNSIMADQWTLHGVLRWAIHTGYPWGAAYSQDPNAPCMVYTPTVGEGMFVISRKLPTDATIDKAQFLHGLNLIAQGRPPAYYRRGHFMSKLGEPSAYDFIDKSDDELRAWLRTWPQAALWLDADVAAVAYYERVMSQHVLAPLGAMPAVNGAPFMPPDPRIALRAQLAQAQAELDQATADEQTAEQAERDAQAAADAAASAAALADQQAADAAVARDSAHEFTIDTQSAESSAQQAVDDLQAQLAALGG